MSQNQLQVARQLLTEKRYAEARLLLKSIDHPTAKRWLEKLDTLAPPKRQKNNYRLLSFVSIASLFAVVAAAIIIFLSRTNSSIVAALPTLHLLPTLTFTATWTDTPTSTETIVPSPTLTETPTETHTATWTPSHTWTLTPSMTPTYTWTPTLTPSLTITPTLTPNLTGTSLAAQMTYVVLGGTETRVAEYIFSTQAAMTAVAMFSTQTQMARIPTPIPLPNCYTDEIISWMDAVNRLSERSNGFSELGSTTDAFLQGVAIQQQVYFDAQFIPYPECLSFAREFYLHSIEDSIAYYEAMARGDTRAAADAMDRFAYTTDVYLNDIDTTFRLYGQLRGW